MSGVGTLWRMLPRSIRTLPADLAVVVAVVVATAVTVFVPGLDETPLRVPLGIAFVLFAPGYALVSALYPRGSRRRDGDGSERSGSRSDSVVERRGAGARSPHWPFVAPLTPGERCVLALGLSVSVVPLLGLGLYFGVGTTGTASFVAAIASLTLVATAAGARRRRRLPPSIRVRSSVRDWYAAGRAAIIDDDSRAAGVVHAAVAVVLVLSVCAVGYAVVTPMTDERFSAVSVLTETDDGELVAGNYPASVEAGTPQSFVFTVENTERRTVEYSVVVVEQAVDNGTVTDQRELTRFETTLDHGGSWRHAHDVAPTKTESDVRVAWLVYLDGSVPSSPSAETAAYSTHLWIDVSASTPDE